MRCFSVTFLFWCYRRSKLRSCGFVAGFVRVAIVSLNEAVLVKQRLTFINQSFNFHSKNEKILRFVSEDSMKKHFSCQVIKKFQVVELFKNEATFVANSPVGHGPNCSESLAKN